MPALVKPAAARRTGALATLSWQQHASKEWIRCMAGSVHSDWPGSRRHSSIDPGISVPELLAKRTRHSSSIMATNDSFSLQHCYDRSIVSWSQVPLLRKTLRYMN